MPNRRNHPKAPKVAAKAPATRWVGLLSNGLAVAVLTFVVDKSWPILRHRNAGPAYVKVNARVEGDQLLLLIRNNSDDPLDLVGARIDVLKPEHPVSPSLDIYPPVSQIYNVQPSAGGPTLKAIPGGFEIGLKIAQSIPAKEADQFGFHLIGPLGPENLIGARVFVEVSDIGGHSYHASL